MECTGAEGGSGDWGADLTSLANTSSKNKRRLPKADGSSPVMHFGFLILISKQKEKRLLLLASDVTQAAPYHRRQAGLVTGLRLPTVLLAELT